MVTIPGYVKRVRKKTPVPRQRSASAEPLSPVAALMRRHDRDRFQTALFAPAADREALFALYAFNYEIARVRESVTQPALGHIRLEWWRENVAAAYAAGAVRRHPVVEALTTVIRRVELTRTHFDRLIDAREADLDDDPPASLAMLDDYAEGTASPLIYLALDALGIRDPAPREAGRHIGIAYALAGLLRALPLRMAAGRPVIPADIAARNGLDLEDARKTRGSAALRAAVSEVAATADAHLRAARGARGARGAIARAALPALLPAVVADRSLRRLKRAGWDPFDSGLSHPDPWQSWRLAVAALRKRF
jgi:NADH dehydrogenase [ubiquinone] 1 alpha subcomplex assembly factor 6